ncbi:cobaltochelatase CobT-related protein [Anaerococcus sp.]|uniref:cobaltochelatase CobT-related protein n=1 Tax=Anaerococcus sp. TaxID=1872515 RepID=UPI002901A1C2|nr:hypothetical protein [Anaerococcus sp.]MDU1828350.1 hypothetical protein [Anaerococcus sp.]MDU1863748.1 hypothetical protein [Anaerococcus sp.]
MTEPLNKIREYNIIWDFADNYKFTPKNTYPMDEIYKNITTGFIIKTFDTKMLDSFFAYIKDENPFYEDFKFITNLLIEDISYRELIKDNLVISNLRKIYAKKIYRKYTHRDPDSLSTQIEKAYYGKVLEKPIIEGPLFKSIYNEIFAINTTDTNILIDKLNKVFKSYFRFDRKKKDEELFDEMVKENKPKDFKSEEEMPSEYSDENIDEQFNIGSAEFTGSNIYFEDKKEDTGKNLMFLNSSKDDYHSSNEFIEDFFGMPIMPFKKVEALERKLAKGIHTNKQLYFTRGEYSNKANARYYKKNRNEQYEKNKSYIESNFSINHRNINELSLAIKNSLANYEDYAEVTKNYGIIDSSKIWRAPVINDYNVFIKEETDHINKFKVDLILDASASQIGRQHIVANQAYIIAKAMDEVNIPIRILGFSTLRDHTIFTLYRDYTEKNKNFELYNFFAAGSNRDGFAFKTLHEIIDIDDNTRHIVIVLSDGKPNDERANINTVKLLDKDQYTGKTAIDDTAFEIRNLRNDNISVLGVFTGEDEDVENAKLIYNRDFVRITNLENFSKVVSVFMKNQILM